MKRRLVLEFTKMNGAGNDFVVVDNRFYNFSDDELAALARALCRRRSGIGADGLLAFSRPEDPACHYRMQYVNADGSRATMCGNGARCLARFARSAGLEAGELRFESDAGVYRARVPEEGEGAPVRLYVPPPRRFTPDLQLRDAPERVPFIWTGTEHVVRFVEDVAGVPVETHGRRLRQDAALAPEGANVNFVEVETRGAAGQTARLRVRTYEKGVEAETPACGTGALAAAVVAWRLGAVAASAVEVRTPGGLLGVGFRPEDGGLTDVYLEGPAEVTFRGTVEVF